MSKDKHKGVARRLELLRWAADPGKDPHDFPPPPMGIPLHKEGGMGMRQRDMRKLIAAGLVRVARRGKFLQSDKIRVSWAVITEAGRNLLARSAR